MGGRGVRRDGPAAGAVLGLLGAHGAAGTSALSVAVACRAARRGLRVALVDGDPTGGGLELLPGIEREPGARWEDLAGARGEVDPSALFAAVPCTLGFPLVSHRAVRDVPSGGAVAAGRWSGVGRAPEPVVWDAVLDACRRGADLVVVDHGSWSLGRVGPRGGRLVLVARGRTPQVQRAVAAARGLADAGRGADSVDDAAGRPDVPVGLAVRMPRHSPWPEHAIQRVTGLPLVAVGRDDPHLGRDTAAGSFAWHSGRRPLFTWADALVGALPGLFARRAA